MTIKKLPLIDIRIDGGTQARVSINEAAIADYADAMTDGATLPPVVVFFDGTVHWLADGFHRFLANKRIGAVTMDAEVRAGALADAQLFSFGANQSHGLRRTNEDKRKAVLGVLGLKPDWADRAIAKHVGVSDKTVAAARPAPICGNSADATAAHVTVTRGGKTYTMDTSGQKEAGRAKRGKPAADEAAPTESELAAAIASTGTRPTVATATASTVTPEQRAPSPVALVEPDDAAPDDGEIADAQRAEAATLDAFRKVLEADDQLGEAMRKVREQAALISGMQSRITGLMNEKNEAIRRVKALQRALSKYEKVAA